MRKGYRLLCGLFPVSPYSTPGQSLRSGFFPSPRPAPAPPTWKSFCFSATRFWNRFRVVELKERTSAWETWRGGNRRHLKGCPQRVWLGGKGTGTLRPDTGMALFLACVSKARIELSV